MTEIRIKFSYNFIYYCPRVFENIFKKFKYSQMNRIFFCNYILRTDNLLTQGNQITMYIAKLL